MLSAWPMHPRLLPSILFVTGTKSGLSRLFWPVSLQYASLLSRPRSESDPDPFSVLTMTASGGRRYSASLLWLGNSLLEMGATEKSTYIHIIK